MVRCVAALALFIGTGSLSAQTAFSIGDSVGVNTNTTYPYLSATGTRPSVFSICTLRQNFLRGCW